MIELSPPNICTAVRVGRYNQAPSDTLECTSVLLNAHLSFSGSNPAKDGFREVSMYTLA